jgi:hypothetical protein
VIKNQHCEISLIGKNFLLGFYRAANKRQGCVHACADRIGGRSEAEGLGTSRQDDAPDAYENPARSAGVMVRAAERHAIVVFLGMHVVVT